MQKRQDESTRVDYDLPFSPGQSFNSRYTLEEITAAERNMRYLSQEEKPATDRDQDEYSDEDTPQTPQAGNAVPNPRQKTTLEVATEDRTVNTLPRTTNDPQTPVSPIQTAHPPFSDERLAADARIVEIIGITGFNPSSDDNVTRRPRDYQDRIIPQPSTINPKNPRTTAPAQTIPVMRDPEDVRNVPQTNIGHNDNDRECSTRELLGGCDKVAR